MAFGSLDAPDGLIRYAIELLESIEGTLFHFNVRTELFDRTNMKVKPSKKLKIVPEIKFQLALLERNFPFTCIYGNNIIDITFERIVVRDHEKLVEGTVFRDMADLFGEAFAPCGVHIRCRFVKERKSDIGQLFQKRESDRKRRRHLFTAGEIDERAFVTVFFQQNPVIFRPFQSAFGVAGTLS